MNYFTDNIEQLTEENTAYRKVIFTGSFCQLVLMKILPGEEIGEEKHDGHDQFFRIEKGTLKFLIDGNEYIANPGSGIIIPSGALHNVINIGDKDAKLYTIYTPKEHPEGTLQETKPL